MSAPSRSASRLRLLLLPVLLLVAWLGIGGTLGPYAGKLGEVATNDQASFLPQSAESTQVIDASKEFGPETLPVIVVWTADRGPVTPEQRQAASRALTGLAERGADAGLADVKGSVSPAIPSKDGRALQGVVQLRSDLGEELDGAV